MAAKNSQLENEMKKGADEAEIQRAADKEEKSKEIKLIRTE
jgi:hypothetical protein